MCQAQNSDPYRLSGGATYFTNSFNGVAGARGSLLGWQSAVEFPAWRNVRFKIDVSGTTGTNAGASQSSYFVLAGIQYEHAIGRERVFAHALVGDMGITRYWGPGAAPGMTASFASLVGGGVDTPVSRHFALRVEGDMQHTNLDPVYPNILSLPYRVSGLPRFIGRFSTGVVWTPRLASSDVQESNSQRETPETEVVVEEENSVGHYHIFAATWWSYLHVGGVEYDRHSWGTFLKARMDYVAEILPVVVLEQPSLSDPYGDKLSNAYTTVHGVGISPLGMRLIWRDGTRFKPYYMVKGGMVGFTQKALSPYASYEDFSLQQATGIQLKLTDKWDLRAGVSDFHFSNGFLVPNNPGIDEMMYGAALSYRLHAGSAAK
ncbi:MAG TPA: hypothetical protein VG267_05710 [Terracidiphilus sp.]|jgi:hypothetical protein|nr:hypothetical protein [Terracidiphilus sp.]